jgi:hypothetical protein
MAGRYIEPEQTRIRSERVDGVEQMRIPFRRNWFALIFLSVWLTGWTFGGIAAMGDLVVSGEPFLFVWLIFWALGWVFAAATVAMQIAGSDIIRVVGRDLETSVGVGKLRFRKLYRGDQIRHLRSSDPNPMGFPWRVQQFPFTGAKAGAIKFDYGAKTICAAGSAEEAEGRMIVEWLRPKLPRSAVEEG